MGVRQPLIPAPSYDVLADEAAEGPNPVRYVNTVMVEPIPFREVPFVGAPRPSNVNDMASTFDIEGSLWWPGESTWQVVHGPLFAVTEPPDLETYADMPQGRQTPASLRRNIRQPIPYGQGDLTEAAGSLGASVEGGST